VGFVNFVYTLAGQEAGVLIGQYARFELKWDTTIYSDWSTQGLVIGERVHICSPKPIFGSGTIGQFVGILVLKKFLHMRDTWVLIISIFTFGASNIPVAFPSNSNMYLSNWIGALGNIPSPVLSSLLTHYVEPDEVWKNYKSFLF
jgi:hypothetical protein